MSNRKQFVTINGTRYDLDYRGNIVDKVGDTILPAWGIAYLGLEVETEGPSFEDIEPGVYQIKLENETGRTLRKGKSGEWVSGGGYLMNKETVAKWHNEGILHRLRMDEEATNA